MNKLKKIFTFLFDFLELYLPMLMFVMVFVLYLMMIGGRLLGTKIGKYFELCQIAFIWCGVLSASFGGRSGDHITFSIVYDKCSERVQRILRIVGDIIIIAVFVILIPYSFESIDFLSIKKSDMVRIPFNIIFAPFMSFLILTVVHYSVQLYKDIRGCFKSGKEDTEA